MGIKSFPRKIRKFSGKRDKKQRIFGCRGEIFFLNKRGYILCKIKLLSSALKTNICYNKIK